MQSAIDKIKKVCYYIVAKRNKEVKGMVNTNKIKAKMKELELTQNDVANILRIRQATANQKINNVRCFTLSEAEA